MLCGHRHCRIPEHLHHPEKMPPAFGSATPCSLCSQPWTPTHLLSLPMGLPLLDISYKKNCTIGVHSITQSFIGTFAKSLA